MITTFERTATWEGIGSNVSNATTVEEILKSSDLDYTVEKRPMFIDVPGTKDKILVPDKCATVRTDTNDILGVVSKKYEICQNQEAFDFIDSVSSETNLTFQKAGMTHNGLIYIIAKLPEITVLGDSFSPNLIFQTSHNGFFTLKTTICPLRIVCQNQFAYSFKKSPNTVSIQHSSQYAAKLKQAEELLRSTMTYMTNFTNTAEELALLKVGNDDNIKEIINSFFKSAEEITERQNALIEQKSNMLFNSYNAEDNQNFKGTAWGLLNGFTDFVTHSSGKKTPNEDTKFLQVTFNPLIIQNFVNHIKSFA